MTSQCFRLIIFSVTVFRHMKVYMLWNKSKKGNNVTVRTRSGVIILGFLPLGSSQGADSEKIYIYTYNPAFNTF